MDLTVNAESFCVKPDEMVFLDRYDYHMIQKDQHYTKYTLIFPPDCIGETEPEGGYALPLILRDTDYNRQQIKPLLDGFFETKDNSTPLISRSYAGLILGKLTAYYGADKEKVCPDRALVAEILQYIELHYTESVTLDSLSKQFGYSKYYLSRLFNERVTDSLCNYVHIVRLRHFVEQYRKKPDGKITDVAMDCGFRSISTFYRCFFEQYGVPPRRYFRQTNQQKNG